MSVDPANPGMWILAIKKTDDFAVVGTLRDWFLREWANKYPTGDGQPLTAFCGSHIECDLDKGTITLTQPKLLAKAEDEYSTYLSKIKDQVVPMQPSVTLQPATDAEHDQAKTLTYRGIVGMLVYLSCWSFPEISHAVSLLSRHCQKWSQTHFDAAVKVLKYCITHRHMGIRWSKGKDIFGVNVIYALADTDFAGCQVTRKSMGGRLIMMNSGPLFWKAKLQTLNTYQHQYSCC